MDEADYRYIDVNTEQNHADTYLFILQACTMQNQAFDHNLQSTYSKENYVFQRCLSLQISTKPPVGCRKGTSTATELLVVRCIITKIIFVRNGTLSANQLAARARAINVR